MAGVKIPNVLKDANVYLAGKSYLGKAEIELPKVTQQTVEHQAMGISGKVEIPLTGVVEKMEATLKFRSFDSEALKKLYDPSEAHSLVAYGTVQRFDPQNARMEEFQVKAEMLVMVKETGMPSFKQAQEEGPEISVSVFHYKLTVDGEEVVEVDPFNYRYVVAGKDLLERSRANLGLQ